MPCWMRRLVQVWCTHCCLVYCRLFYQATDENETVVLSGLMWHIQLGDAQQAAEPLSASDPTTGSHDDPEQAEAPSQGPNRRLGPSLTCLPRHLQVLPRWPRLGPGLLSSPLQAPAPPAETVVATSPPKAVTSTAGSKAKVQHAPLLMHARHCATDRLLAYTIRPA